MVGRINNDAPILMIKIEIKIDSFPKNIKITCFFNDFSKNIRNNKRANERHDKEKNAFIDINKTVIDYLISQITEKLLEKAEKITAATPVAVTT